jgi:hypothetical protein
MPTIPYNRLRGTISGPARLARPGGKKKREILQMCTRGVTQHDFKTQTWNRLPGLKGSPGARDPWSLLRRVG